MITGGSSGIGAELARELTRRGWRCVLVARGEERLRSLADELGAEAEVCDVGDQVGRRRAGRACHRPASADQAARQQRGHPRPRRLPHGRSRADRERDARQLLRRRLVPARIPSRARGRGALGRRQRRLGRRNRRAPPVGPYAASKHAQLAFSRAVAAQLRPRGVRVHTVLPGFSPTAGLPRAERAAEGARVDGDRARPDRRTIVRSVARDRRESFVPWWFRRVAVLQGSSRGCSRRGFAWFVHRFGRPADPRLPGR